MKREREIKLKNKTSHLKRQLRVFVQIQHHRLRQLRVPSQLLGVHPQAHDARCLIILRVVRYPARAEVEQGDFLLVGGERGRRRSRGKVPGVEVGQGGDGSVVNVGDEPRGVVEERVVGPAGVRRREGKSFRGWSSFAAAVSCFGFGFCFGFGSALLPE